MVKLLGFLHKVNSVNDVLSKLSGIVVIGLSIAIMADVIGRRLGHPFSWVGETSIYLYFAVSILSLGYAQRKGAHFKTDILVCRLSGGTKTILEIITSIIAFSFAVVLTWKGLEAVLMSYQQGRLTPSELHIPYYVIYLALPIGGVVLCLAIVERIVGCIAILRGHNEGKSD
ncbi:MAG: TRAP transporter small permease subunit [Bacillota bacterium]